ncbi:class I SAM-dependent methyltransferase [Ureibacillus chungkukjangi]|uniref:23S rRNA (Guanine745-N1)-methyltransferase n=1 Tax=Ureibacillus chungkukjangi TaxID=1202712 RepID=A0A318TX20_9BACL|nr:class I SAM-dependent methyltransferase [Ureibacillus chungkukjangi]PYF08933.1 23S rRNA (guanine745-N1)-methyltransferase [Ureibacillus chungkukjangi]
MKLIDPTTLAGWLMPHSLEWYKQLSVQEGKYVYPWNSTHTEPNGESIFDREVTNMIPGKKVLDVGCGHGGFTLQCSEIANEIVGFDVTDRFVQEGSSSKKSNVTFVRGNSKERLPFKEDEFDCAYIRKGPTSAYSDLKRVVKESGVILGLHPGDESSMELPFLFPNLFQVTKDTPILDTIHERMVNSEFANKSLEKINSIEYINSPIDILKLCCFGQHPSILEIIKEKNLPEVTRIFEKNASEKGLAITFSRYLIRVKV